MRTFSATLTWLRFGRAPPGPGLGEAEPADSDPAGLSEASTSASAISTPGCATGAKATVRGGAIVRGGTAPPLVSRRRRCSLACGPSALRSRARLFWNQTCTVGRGRGRGDPQG